MKIIAKLSIQGFPVTSPVTEFSSSCMMEKDTMSFKEYKIGG